VVGAGGCFTTGETRATAHWKHTRATAITHGLTATCRPIADAEGNDSRLSVTRARFYAPRQYLYGYVCLVGGKSAVLVQPNEVAIAGVSVPAADGHTVIVVRRQDGIIAAIVVARLRCPACRGRYLPSSSHTKTDTNAQINRGRTRQTQIYGRARTQHVKRSTKRTCWLAGGRTVGRLKT